MHYSNHLRPGHHAFYLVLLAFSTFLSAPLAYAQLSGTYTIGSAGDYATFNAATTALETEGISGPVTFSVQPGTYSEQVEITSIPGSSCEVPVVFEGIIGDSSQVVLGTFSDYVLKINQVDGISFRYITLTSSNPNADIINLNQADCFTLTHSQVLGQGQAPPTLIRTFTLGKNATITNNYFSLSSGYSIYIATSDSRKGDLTFVGNVAEDISGILINGLEDLIFQNNLLSLTDNYQEFVDGIDLGGYNAGFSQPISDNKISISSRDSRSSADFSIISLNNDFLRNEVVMNGVGARRLNIDLSVNEDKEITIANNILHNGLTVRSDSDTDLRLNFYFNTLYDRLDIGSFNYDGGDAFSFLDIKNNILAGRGDEEEGIVLDNGEALAIRNANTPLSSDYNVFSSPNPQPFVIGGEAYTFSDWQ